jgi:hypothetical protein
VPRQPPPWLGLLQRLTEISPCWGVWKNADSALAGKGDIDSVSPRRDREALLREFRGWAVENRFAPIFTCAHLPGSVLAVALRDRSELVELQLCEQAMFRGSTLFEAADLVRLMSMDKRGFRRLRPGAEGLLLLLHNGMRHGGRPAYRSLHDKGIIRLLQSDRTGVEAATYLFGAARESAYRLATAVLRGGWDRPSAIAVEVWAASRSLGNPRLLALRAVYQLTGGRYCPMLPILRRGRKLEGDVDEWLSRAKSSHRWSNA